MAAGGTSYTSGSYTDPYPTYPNSESPGEMNRNPSQMSGPGTRMVPAKPVTSNPYTILGKGTTQFGQGTANMQDLPDEEDAGEEYSAAGQAGSYNPPYSLYGLQYSLDKAMTAEKNVMHFQNGDIRGSADMSGGAKVSENPGKVSAVSAALEASAAGRVKGARAFNQQSAFKQAQKGAKAGRPAKDMRLRHAGTQADVNSATTGY